MKANPFIPSIPAIYLFTILLILFAPISSTIAQTELPSALFVDGPDIALREMSPTIDKRRSVQIDQTALRQARTKGAKLELNLFPESSFIGVVKSVQARSDSNYTLLGELQGQEFSSFVLVANEDVVVMNIRPGNEGLIQVRYLGAGVHDIQKIDETQFPPCETGPEQIVDAPKERQAGDLDPLVESDAGDIIDVMVVYTPSARAAAGGTAAIQALVNLAITESNTAYEESLINPRLRLAYVGEIAYVESDSFSTDLSRLQGTSDGYMDEVHTLRNTHAADMVSLWVNNSASCGIGYVMTTLTPAFESHAFSTVHYTCATGYYSFGHELGHNMGCRHDRQNSSGSGLDSYSYGWRFNGTNNLQYRTIMAYAPGTRIQRFSNPNVNYFGTPTGVPIGNAEEAFNTQTINNSAYQIANFRQASSASGPPVIGLQPLSQSVFTGDSALFSVSATGASPLTYHWRKEGSIIPGATLSSYSFNNIQLRDAGNYSVIVSNAHGTATSDNASLSVALGTSLGEAVDNLGFNWFTGGNGTWSGQHSVSYDGVDSAQSGSITHSQLTWIQTTITGPGTLTFRWRVSSEASWDFLRFYVNDVQLASISGEVNWQLRTFAIPAGSHTARWSYTKDISINSGLDKGWLDQVIFIAPSSIQPLSAKTINGQFHFQFTGAPGASYTVYGSTNLASWNSLTTFTSTNSSSLFIDTSSNGSQHFYRVGSP
ncbi:MAG: immunoglobulin domain-containing protein [Verrucomicrobia bacterium]|nr:immunoglobulin domain-containing protein [Verrucomicrobiota bacterium]